MNRSEKIEKLIQEAFPVDGPKTGMDERILNDASTVMKQACAAAAQRHPVLDWRQIMRSPITRIAAVLALALGLIWMWGNGADSNGAPTMLSLLNAAAAAENTWFTGEQTVHIVNEIVVHARADGKDLAQMLQELESDYYESLDPPYTCPNKPLSHINDFFLIKGVAELAAEAGGRDLFLEYITHHGVDDENEDKKMTFPGKININTADVPVLAAILPFEEGHLAPDLASWRDEKSESGYANDLKDPEWYKSAIDLGDKSIDSNLITTQSDIFRIQATGVLYDIKLTTTAVVKRVKEKKTGKYICKVLYWQNE